MINLVLKTGKLVDEGAIYGSGIDPLTMNRDKSTQQSVQGILILIAALCIPIMLLPKPCVMVRRIKHHKEYNGGEGRSGEYQAFENDISKPLYENDQGDKVSSSQALCSHIQVD